MKCWCCAADLAPNEFGRGDSCQKCGRDTKVCKNCIYYDPKYHNECKETQADRIVEKERSNFCDYFVPFSGNRGGLNQGKESARNAAEALFKKK